MHEMEGPRPVSLRSASDCSEPAPSGPAAVRRETSPSAPVLRVHVAQVAPGLALAIDLQLPEHRLPRVPVNSGRPFVFRTQVALRPETSSELSFLDVPEASVVCLEVAFRPVDFFFERPEVSFRAGPRFPVT